MKALQFHPTLLNTPCPWCSDLEQLRALYACPHIGAVTTRTSMLEPFPHNPDVNQFVLFDSTAQKSAQPNVAAAATEQTASLNTIGFSPTNLDGYLGFIKTISDEQPDNSKLKPFIVSVTGSPEEMCQAYRKITAFQSQVKMDLIVEINLSCPNIPGKISPAYDANELLVYLTALQNEILALKAEKLDRELPIGIKTPPFTYQDQFDTLLKGLRLSTENPSYPHAPIAYISSTNTLGSSLLLQQGGNSVLNSMAGTGIGGMAGTPIHALSLGNVYTIRQMLDAEPKLKHIQIIGVGGVNDKDGFNRMKHVGAYAVGVATALGVKGIKVFEEIAQS